MRRFVALNLRFATTFFAGILLRISLIIGCGWKDITHMLYPDFLSE
jgi:hypothetical protein